MLDQINSFLKKIFSNEETIVFSFVILCAFLMMTFFGSVLTPFLISIVVAYLLVGVQKKIESFNISSKWALVITFAIFIVTGAAMLLWLLPILIVLGALGALIVLSQGSAVAPFIYAIF